MNRKPGYIHSSQVFQKLPDTMRQLQDEKQLSRGQDEESTSARAVHLGNAWS